MAESSPESLVGCLRAIPDSSQTPTGPLAAAEARQSFVESSVEGHSLIRVADGATLWVWRSSKYFDFKFATEFELITFPFG
jgi:hypothetical protein